MPTEERLKRGETPQRPPLVTGGRSAPPMPRGMNERAQTAWRTIIADLASSGVIDRADATILEVLATTVGRYRQARTIVNHDGLTAQNSQGTVAHPLVGVMERAENRITQLVDRLPLSPWGRARLGLMLSSGGDEGAEAEMEEVIGPSPRQLVVVGGSRG